MTRSLCRVMGFFKNRPPLRLLAVATLLMVAGISFAILSPNSPRNRASALACTREWGRVASFPVANDDVVLETDGGMFTRSFRTSFVATAEEIETWLRQSPGIADAVASAPSPGLRHFTIKAGGGAQGAEVTVDDRTHRVSIYVYWS